MATKTLQTEQPAVRKGLLVVAGVAVGAALIGYLLMTFVLNGGGGSPSPATSTGTVPGVVAPVQTATPPPANNEITGGGRDPFSGGPQGLAPVSAPAGAPAAQASAVAAPKPTTSVLASSAVNPHFTLSVVKVSGSAADLTYNGEAISGVHAGDKLPDGVVVNKISAGCASFSQGGQGFSVCQGQTVKR